MAQREAVGVDGCKSGWIAIILEEGAYHEACFFRDFASLYGATPDARVIAVDIPISLPEREPRQADLAAKKLLTTSSTPPRRHGRRSALRAAKRASCRMTRENSTALAPSPFGTDKDYRDNQ
jgi:predicted RNase H-like nuclease